MGRPRADPLLPILRSEAQGRILATLFLSAPDEPLHVSALAERTGVPLSTVQREVDRLESSELVTSQRFAQARLVRANEAHPLADDLHSLLLKAYGPAAVLAERLDHVDKIEEAFIFGSWAARYEGQRGPPPADVDVLVIGTPAVNEVYDASARAEERLGRPVNPTIVSRDEWEARSSGFLRTLHERPLVRVLPRQ
jgi:predicted nucleotidyltransferase